jgi:hypothetical protein
MTNQEIDRKIRILQEAKTKKEENRREYLTLSKDIIAICRKLGYTEDEIDKKLFNS